MNSKANDLLLELAVLSSEFGNLVNEEVRLRVRLRGRATNLELGVVSGGNGAPAGEVRTGRSQGDGANSLLL